ncbi:hypothetical protein KC887_06440 [Candidatus Kaiserbacteria bacterium]|nr:hypothetical protein [Candidatus Kaiserbacteria bacterium]
MAIENKGPGGVSNSYGVRGTVDRKNYKTDTQYQEVYGGEGVAVTAKTNPDTGGVEIYGPTGRLPLIQIVGMSAVPVSLTGTTAETALASINFPAMGPNDALRVSVQWSFTGSANLKSLVTKLNGATFGLTTTSTASHVISKQELSLINRNATNIQLGSMYGFGYSSATSGSFLSPSVETSGANTLTLHGQLANAGETITLEGYVVELIRKGGAA